MKRKLNNHGWGFSTFIAFIGVFILAIILITIGAVKMGIGSKNSLPLDVPVTTTSPTPTNPPVSRKIGMGNNSFIQFLILFKLTI